MLNDCSSTGIGGLYVRSSNTATVPVKLNRQDAICPDAATDSGCRAETPVIDWEPTDAATASKHSSVMVPAELWPALTATVSTAKLKASVSGPRGMPPS